MKTKKKPSSIDPRTGGASPLFDPKQWRATGSGWKQSILIAGPFLTCFPWPHPRGRRTRADLGKSVRAFPLIGLMVGAVGGAVLWLLLLPGVSPLAASLVALAVITVLTGGLHEDGLADSADGLFGGDTPDQRLALMRQGVIGAYGALALIFSVALRGALLASLEPLDMISALLAAVSASRVAPVILAHRLKPARTGGLASGLGDPPADSYHAALILAAIFLFLFLGLPGAILAIIMTGCVLYGLEYLAKTRLGGTTGDIMGAGQQVTEVSILLAAAIMV